MNWTDRLQGLLTEKDSRIARVDKNIAGSQRAAASAAAERRSGKPMAKKPSGTSLNPEGSDNPSPRHPEHKASVADRKRTATGYYQTQTRGNSDDTDNTDNSGRQLRTDKAAFVPGSADEGGNRDFRGPKRQTAGGRNTGTKIPASQRTPAATAGRVSARRAASQKRKPSQFSAGDPGARGAEFGRRVVGALRGALGRVKK